MPMFVQTSAADLQTGVANEYVQLYAPQLRPVHRGKKNSPRPTEQCIKLSTCWNRSGSSDSHVTISLGHVVSAVGHAAVVQQ